MHRVFNIIQYSDNPDFVTFTVIDCFFFSFKKNEFRIFTITNSNIDSTY